MWLIFLPVQRYASAVLVIARCMSVTTRCSVKTFGRIELVIGMDVSNSTNPALCYKEIGVSAKVRVLPSESLSQLSLIKI